MNKMRKIQIYSVECDECDKITDHMIYVANLDVGHKMRCLNCSSFKKTRIKNPKPKENG